MGKWSMVLGEGLGLGVQGVRVDLRYICKVSFGNVSIIELQFMGHLGKVKVEI